MLTEVRPVPDVKKWHGKKGKEAFAQPKTIEVLYDDVTGRYATGLSADDMERLAKEMPGVDFSDTFNPSEAHPHWSDKASWISLPNQTVVFDTNRTTDFVKVANLKASKFVANSLKEYNDGVWPDATHVIFSEEEEMELKASKFQLQQSASVKLMDMSLDAKIALVRVLSTKNIKNRSPNYIDGVISELVQDKPKELLETIALGKDEVTLRALVIEGLSKQILTKQGQAIYYMGDKLGLDYDDTLRYFKDPNNAQMKVILLQKLGV